MIKIAFARFLALLSLACIMSGCASNHAPLPTPEQVDLKRFMGPWFVHGYTPLLVDKKAHNAVEHYYMNENGRIETTYRFRDGGFDGPLKAYTPKGFPEEEDPSNAHWQMQFIWPFKSDYVIMYVSEDYSRTIVAHPNRKYAWIMDRETSISDSDYAAMLAKLEAAGFDPDIIQRLPQDWSEESDRLEYIRKIGASAPLVER